MNHIVYSLFVQSRKKGVFYFCSTQNVDFVLGYQSQPFQLSGILLTGGEQIDPGGFNAGVAKHIGQAGDIPAGLVKYNGKQMAKIMGKHLCGLYSRIFAQCLHLRPDLPTR